MNTENKSELPLQTLRFNRDLSTGRLRHLMGDVEIVRIERGAWHCFVEFRSRQNARELEASIEQWLQDFKAEQSAKHEGKHAAIYAKHQEEMAKNPPYVPASQVLSGGKRVEGYMFFYDDGKLHYIFPDDPPNNAVTPINTG